MSGDTPAPVAQPLSAEDIAPARRGGPRVSTFDNGRQEHYESVFVQHPGGEWDRILIARDDGRIAALLVGLINDAARSVPDGDGDPATFCDICDETCECEPIPVAPAGLDDHHHPDTLCPICRYWYVALASPEEPR